MQTLQSRQKWRSHESNLQNGDVVLLKEKCVSRNEWPLGVVNNVFPSDDDLVRKVEIRVIVNGNPVNYIIGQSPK